MQMPECSYHHVGKEIVQICSDRDMLQMLALVLMGCSGTTVHSALVESFEATLPTGAQTSLEPEGRIRNVRPWWWDVVGVGACCKIL